MTEQAHLEQYRNALSHRHQVIRLMWAFVWAVFARPFPRSVGSGWKRFLLRLFGANIPASSCVYSSARIYYPANLVLSSSALPLWSSIKTLSCIWAVCTDIMSATGWYRR